jgi:hypothetical protein
MGAGRNSKEWSIALIHPIHKKNYKTNCSNYRGISLLNVTYKVMAKIIAMRFTSYTEELLGDYQCGFRKIDPQLTIFLR